jgi:hypothetical protein
MNKVVYLIATKDKNQEELFQLLLVNNAYKSAEEAWAVIESSYLKPMKWMMTVYEMNITISEKEKQLT